MGGDTPKAYRLLAGKPMVASLIECFAQHPQVTDILIMHHANHGEFVAPLRAAYPTLSAVAGGETRQESVRLGLDALAETGCTHVLIHDAARPFMSHGLIDQLIDALQGAEAVLPATPVVDTIKQVRQGKVEQTIPRDALVAAQTPQAFAYPLIHELHHRFKDKSATDDVQLAEWANIPVALVDGEKDNIKLTYKEDWQMAEQKMSGAVGDYAPRVGFGYDVHKLVPHDASAPTKHRMIRLGGVDIASPKRLDGHSDADVVLHALTDALLGAIAEGDIGQHFPPSEPKWRGADSSIFVIGAKGLCKKHQAVIQNIDITIIAQQPRITPYREEIRERIAEILDIAVSKVSVKATTTEGLGFAGRGEGIAAHAVACVMVPVE